jgi:hypothetical protein
MEIYRIGVMLCAVLHGIGLTAQSYDWTAVFPSSSNSIVQRCAIDPAGNIYLCGNFEGSIDLDPGPANVSRSSTGANDIFVVSLNQQGAYRWGYTFGSTGVDAALGVATDAFGNVYFSGFFNGTIDFNPGVGVNNLTGAGGNDIFITRYDTAGNFKWAFRVGAAGDDKGNYIHCSDSGYIVASGMFSLTVDFDPGPRDMSLVSGGSTDAWVMKLDSNANVHWAKRLGGTGTGTEVAYAVAVGRDGRVYSTGTFNGNIDLDPGPGARNITTLGGTDIFISVLDASGNYIKGERIGSAQFETVTGLALNAYDDIHLTGYFQTTCDFDPGAGTASRTSKGGNDVYVLKLDSAVNFKWVNSMGGLGADISGGITCDDRNNILIAGSYTQTVDLDPGPDTFSVTSRGNQDVFVCKFHADGSFISAFDFGGTSSEYADCIAAGKYGSVYTGGRFSGTVDFDPGAGKDEKSSGGSSVAYLQKVGLCRPIVVDTQIRVCGFFDAPSGRRRWTVSGLYADTLISAEGCDSILHIDLTVNYRSFGFLVQQVCNYIVSPGGTKQWVLSGIYRDTIANYLGCDSIVTVDLTVRYTGFANMDAHACAPYTSPSGKFIWTHSGVYDDTLNSQNGCGVILRVNLNMGSPTQADIAATACKSYTSPSGRFVWMSSGTYLDILSNHSGCDSLLVVRLTLNRINTMVSMNGNTLTAEEPDALYQWLNCDQGYAAISGETGRELRLARQGNYAVAITKNACTDTSECSMLSPTGQAWLSMPVFRLFPNPVSGILHVQVSGLHGDLHARLMDLSGRQIEMMHGNREISQSFRINQTAGFYLLQLFDDRGNGSTFKILVQ